MSRPIITKIEKGDRGILCLTISNTAAYKIVVLKVYIKKWIDVLTDAEARHQYIKSMLNHSISEDEEGIELLKKKYSMYLPEQLLVEAPKR